MSILKKKHELFRKKNPGKSKCKFKVFLIRVEYMLIFEGNKSKSSRTTSLLIPHNPCITEIRNTSHYKIINFVGNQHYNWGRNLRATAINRETCKQRSISNFRAEITYKYVVMTYTTRLYYQYLSYTKGNMYIQCSKEKHKDLLEVSSLWPLA